MNECMKQAQDPGERASQGWGAMPLSPVSSSQGLFWDAPSPSPWLPHPSSQLEEAPPESPESPHRGTDHCTTNASSRVAYDWGPPEGKGLPRPCSFSCPRHRGQSGGTLSKHARRRKPPNSCVVPQVPPCLLGKPEGASFGGHTTSRVVGALTEGAQRLLGAGGPRTARGEFHGEVGLCGQLRKEDRHAAGEAREGRREQGQAGVTTKRGSHKTRFKFQKDRPGAALFQRRGGRLGPRGKEPGSGFDKPGSKPGSASWQLCGPGQVPPSTTSVSSSVKWGQS